MGTKLLKFRKVIKQNFKPLKKLSCSRWQTN